MSHGRAVKVEVTTAPGMLRCDHGRCGPVRPKDTDPALSKSTVDDDGAKQDAQYPLNSSGFRFVKQGAIWLSCFRVVVTCRSVIAFIFASTNSVSLSRRIASSARFGEA